MMRDVTHQHGVLLWGRRHTDIYIHIDTDKFTYLSGWQSAMLMFEKFVGQLGILEQCLLSQSNIHEQDADVYDTDQRGYLCS